MPGLIRSQSYFGLAANGGGGEEPEHPHEPEGMTTDVDSPWDVLPLEYPTYSSEGWRWEYTNARLSLIQPGDCPKSPPNAIRGTYPVGFGGGSAPVNVETAVPLCDELYMHVWTRWSANWNNNGNTGTKFGFVFSQGSSPYTNWFINANDDFGIQMETSGATGSPGMADFAAQGFSNRLDWYLTSDAVNDGSWQEWEIWAKANTGTDFNGSIRYWRNGVLEISSDQVKWFGDNMTKRWNRVQWSPTYGGGNNPVPIEQYMDIDHWYVSYKVNGF